MLELILQIFFIVVLFAALIMIVENNETDDPESKLEFFDSFFFIMTTISVIGYGSSVATIYGIIGILVLIGLVMQIINDMSSKIILLSGSQSKYARRLYKASENVPFVVLLGAVTYSSLFNFLKEYFSEDHTENMNRHCVILNPHHPCPKTEVELNSQRWAGIVRYLEGSPLNESDLFRCQIERAQAIIILSDKLSNDAQREDTNTILYAMMIKDYLQVKRDENKKLPNAKICMQLLRPESITHYNLSAKEKEQMKDDQVFCIESLKLNLLAKSCLCPGLVVLVTNLIQSSADPPS